MKKAKILGLAGFIMLLISWGILYMDSKKPAKAAETDFVERWQVNKYRNFGYYSSDTVLPLNKRISIGPKEWIIYGCLNQTNPDNCNSSNYNYRIIYSVTEWNNSIVDVSRTTQCISNKYWADEAYNDTVFYSSDTTNNSLHSIAEYGLHIIRDCYDTSGGYWGTVDLEVASWPKSWAVIGTINQ